MVREERRGGAVVAWWLLGGLEVARWALGGSEAEKRSVAAQACDLRRVFWGGERRRARVVFSSQEEAVGVALGLGRSGGRFGGGEVAELGLTHGALEHRFPCSSGVGNGHN